MGGDSVGKMKSLGPWVVGYMKTSIRVYDSWKMKKIRTSQILPNQNPIYVCVSIYICLYSVYIINICQLGPPLIIYLTCKREKEMKEKLSWPPSLPLTLTCYFIHSLSLSPPPSLSLSMKSPSQLPPQYQHQQQLETPYFFNTLTTTAQTIWKLYISDELFPSHHIMLVMENVCP